MTSIAKNNAKSAQADLNETLPPPQELERDSLGEVRIQNNEDVEAHHIKLDHDELPQNWPDSKKWVLTIVVASISGTVTYASSIHGSAVRMYIRLSFCVIIANYLKL